MNNEPNDPTPPSKQKETMGVGIATGVAVGVAIGSGMAKRQE